MGQCARSDGVPEMAADEEVVGVCGDAFAEPALDVAVGKVADVPAIEVFAKAVEGAPGGAGNELNAAGNGAGAALCEGDEVELVPEPLEVVVVEVSLLLREEHGFYFPHGRKGPVEVVGALAVSAVRRRRRRGGYLKEASHGGRDVSGGAGGCQSAEKGAKL